MSKAFNARQVLDDLQDEDRGVKIRCLSMLSSLPAVGAVPLEVLTMLEKLLRTTDNRLVLNSVLVAINHLATFDRTKMMFGDSTTVQEALISHVEKFNAPIAQYGALEVLVNLTNGYEPNQIQLMTMANKLIIPVVGIIQREGERTRKMACKLLDQLVVNEKCVELLCQETQRVVKTVDIEDLKRDAERERKRFQDMEGTDEEEEPTYEQPEEVEEEHFEEQNLLEPLVICLQVLDRSIQEWATAFFEHVATSRGGFFCRYLAEVAIVEPLVKLLHSSKDSLIVVMNVLKILNNLTGWSDRCRQYIGEAQAGQMLCSILRKNTPGLNSSISIAHSQSPAVRTLTSLSMALLMNITQTKAESTNTGLMESTSSNKSSGPNLQSGYVEIADPINLKRAQISIVKEKGLKVLYQYIRPIQYGGSGDEESDVVSRRHMHELQERAVRIVANIARVEENAIRVLTMKAPPIDPKLLKEMKEKLEEERRLERGEPKEEPVTPTTPATPFEEAKVNKPPPPPVPKKPSSPSEPVEGEQTEPVDGESKINKPPPPPLPEKPSSPSETVEAAPQKPVEEPVEAIPEEEEYKGDAPSLVDLLLDLLVEKRDTQELKKNVIECYSNFSIHDECVVRLVQMGVIERLLEMLRGKVEVLIIGDLFSRMNEHASFQRLFYQNKGMKPLVLLLRSRDETEIEAALRAVGPFVYTPNGRIILQREGVFKLVREHMKRPGIIGKMSKKIMKVLKQEGMPTIAGNTGAMVTTIVNGEEVTTFVEFDWDEAHRIDMELVAHAQKRLQEMTHKHHFKLTINWRSMERTPQYLGLLSRENLWDELVLAIDDFLGDDTPTIHTFNSQVQMIVVEVNGAAEGNSIEVADLVMRYKIASDGSLWSPKTICKVISEDLLGYDLTEFNDMLEDASFDEEYVQGIEALKRCASDARIPMIGDLNLLYFHLETADQLYHPTFLQSQIIVACKAVIDEDELLIKAWPIIKYNKKGFKQERLLMLTNLSYYTVAFDAKARRIDYKHCKVHNLEDYYLIDVGEFVSGNEKKDAKKRDSSSDVSALDGEEYFGMNLVTNEKPHKGGKKEKNEDDDEQTEDDDLMTALDDDKDDDDDLTSTIAQELDSMSPKEIGDNVITEVKVVRPSIKGKYCSVIIAPPDIKRNRQKQYLQEIAWCFYAAASSVRRSEVNQPFDFPVKKPKASLLASWGNKLGAGVKGNFETAGHSKALNKMGEQFGSKPIPKTEKEIQKEKEEQLQRRKSLREKFFGQKV